MNKAYSKESKKDRFITDHLLPYLLKYIDDSDNPDAVTDSVARMCIFPYKTTNGVRIGSLKETGISWYYVSENDKSRVSSGSYRVFADDTMKQEQIRRFRQIFSDRGLINEFSDAAVIKDLIIRMSEESDYTELWWTYAYDVFCLWNPEKDNMDMSAATKSFNNNYFLFDENYRGSILKDELIRFGVFRDIINDLSRRVFWNKIPMTEKAKAKTLLKKFGVPCSFVYTIEKWNGEHMQSFYHINPYILNYTKVIRDNVRFPVAQHEGEQALCNLSHILFMDIIYKESKDAFDDAVYDEDEVYNAGVVVKNIDGDFVPLSWHLFYSENDLNKNKSDDQNGLYLEWVGFEKNDMVFEFLHIDAALYDQKFIVEYDKIHEFSEVDLTADEYDISEEDTEGFYKWIWNYSKHEALADNILFYYSGDHKNRTTLKKNANDFVLSVIENSNFEDADYTFDIDLQDDEAFLHARTINKISTLFTKVYAVVYGNYRRIDVKGYLDRVLNVTKTDHTMKGIIENDDIWRHTYLTDGKFNSFDGVFVRCKIYENGYEDAILLWPSDDEDSYVRALAEYVRLYYDVEVSIEDSFDWKEEYLKLAHDIREFITAKTERRLLESLPKKTPDLNDVEKYGLEKRIWQNLKAQRERIMAHERNSCPVDLSSWRSFLSAKYMGRCQLCGGITITGEQDARFFTYRLVKPSELARKDLADMSSNMFCLCPTCWGEMEQGEFMGKDMSELLNKSLVYAEYIEQKINSGDMEDGFPSLVSEVWEDQVLTEEDEEKLEGFHNPIVCHVMVNGKDRTMAFSWEHFIRIAFILSETEEVEE